MPWSELRQETGTQNVSRHNASARVAIDTSDACTHANVVALLSRHNFAVSTHRNRAATAMNKAAIVNTTRSVMLSNIGPPGKNRTADANPAKLARKTQPVVARTREKVGRRRGRFCRSRPTRAAPAQVITTTIRSNNAVAETMRNLKI